MTETVSYNPNASISDSPASIRRFMFGYVGLSCVVMGLLALSLHRLPRLVWGWLALFSSFLLAGITTIWTASRVRMHPQEAGKGHIALTTFAYMIALTLIRSDMTPVPRWAIGLFGLLQTLMVGLFFTSRSTAAHAAALTIVAILHHTVFTEIPDVAQSLKAFTEIALPPWIALLPAMSISGSQLSKRKEASYRDSLIEVIPTATMILDRDDTIIYVNQRFTELYGYELAKDTDLQFWLGRASSEPDFRAQVMAPWSEKKTLLSQTSGNSRILEIPCKDGEVRYARFNVVALQEGTRAVTLDDVSKQIQTEEVLRHTRHDWKAQTKEWMAKIEKLDREVELIHKSTFSLSSSLDLHTVLDDVLEEARKSLHAVGCSIWLFEKDTDQFVCYKAAGPQAKVMPGEARPADKNPFSAVLRLKIPLKLKDENHKKTATVTSCEKPSPGPRSRLLAPMQVRGKTIGALEFIHSVSNEPGASEYRTVESIATVAAAAINNAKLSNETQQELERRSQVEEALRQSELKYRNLIEISPEAIIAADADLQIVMCNQQALELFGYQQHYEIIGQPAAVLYGSEIQETIQARKAELDREGRLTDLELTMRRQDGSRFYAEVSVSRVLNAEEETIQFVGFARDITERKQAENAIRQRNYELSVLNEVTTEIIRSQHDLEPLLDVALTQTMDALSLRTGWIEIDADKLRNRADDLYITKGALRTGEEHGKMEKEMRRRAFERVRTHRRPFLESDISLSHVYSEPTNTLTVGCVPLIVDGEVTGVLGMLSFNQSGLNRLSPEDMELLNAIGNQISLAIKHTQLADDAAQATRLREIDRLRSELIANFSHELRSPLGIIQMSSSTLLREDIDLDQRKRHTFLKDIEEQTAHLANIVDGVLDLGHLQSGSLEISIENITLESVISEAVNHTSTQSSDHTITTRIPDLRLDVDAKRLRVVMTNLIDNAIKYMPDGGDIQIDAEQRAGEIWIRVTDHGIGIPEDELEAIFERFYRVRNAATDKATGSGLGLAICKAIVESHNGRIWAKSRLGCGTTMTVVLPMKQEHLGAAEDS